MRIDTTIEEILEEENIKSAAEHIKRNCEAGSDSKERLSLEYWTDNKSSIVSAIKSRAYDPEPAMQYEQLNKRGKRRKITVMFPFDQILSRAINQKISPNVDKLLSSRCFGFRPGKGTKNAAEFSASQIETGREWVAVLDIKNYFDSILHDTLQKMLSELLADESLLALIMSFVSCRIKTDEGEYRLARGLIQGMPLSPLLSNIYLASLDLMFEKTYPGYCRYGDDMRFYIESQEQGEKAFEECKKEIEKLGLSLNQSKCGVYRALNKSCLGYDFIEKAGHVLIAKVERQHKEVYQLWHRASIKELDHNYHLVSPGILTKKDFSLIFEGESEKKYLPQEVMDSLSIYTNVIFSSGFFELANQEGFSVTFIDRFGRTTGRFIPEAWKRNIRVELAQAQTASDKNKRLALAKTFQHANIFNIRAALRYYERRMECDTIKDTIQQLSVIIDKVKAVDSTDLLMVLEAQARQAYFGCFNKIMAGDDFEFVKRTRRPPEDPLNAMISFGNTLLYTRMANEIYQSSLDIRFGLLHSISKRHENLNLDLADLFKPILVDRTIFTLVNRKMINEVQDFEETDQGGVFLTDHGKRIFIREFEIKLKNTITIKGIKTSYSELLRREVKKLQNYFQNGAPYKPYKYVN